MKAKLICAALVVSILIFSCHNASKEQAADVAVNTLMAPAPIDEKEQRMPAPMLGPEPVVYDSVPPVVVPSVNKDWDKKIIKTATVKLEVKKFKEYNEGLHKKIKQYGGYIASEDNFFTEEKSEMVVALKVPVQQFEMLMNELDGNDIKVIERSIKTEDVTGQVVDTRSRLEAKKQMRIKYMEFLKQSKNMAEVLQVQAEINSIQEEIEAAAGRMQYLSNQSAFSTINLIFYEPLMSYNPGNDSPAFISNVIEAFKTGASFIKTLLLGLITIWPLWVIGFVILYIRKRNRPAKNIHPAV